MRTTTSLSLICLLALPLACADRAILEASTDSESATDSESGASETSGDESVGTASGGDGDPGDGEPGDGEPGDGEPGDGDPGDGDPGDGDPGDGDPGDGDPGDGDPGDGDPGDGDPGDGDPGDGDPGDGDPDGIIDLVDFAIGATEVTIGEYQAFMQAGVGFNGLPGACAWKTDYTPGSWNNQLGANSGLPVTRVDWCDAWAYCDWAGLHLCGNVGGQPADLGDVVNAVDNEWFRACSGDGATLFPYGDLYEGMTCNGVEYGAGALTVAGSIQTCEGGAPGLFDMSGNVWEWTNACAVDPNISDELEDCRRRGGSYFSSGNIMRCGVDSVRPRQDRFNNTGIRCCGL